MDNEKLNIDKYKSPAWVRKKCLTETKKLMEVIRKRLIDSKSKTIKNRLERVQLKLIYLYSVNCVWRGYFVEPKYYDNKLFFFPYINTKVPLKYIDDTPDNENPLNEKRGGARKGGGLKKGQRLKADDERRTAFIQIKLTVAEKELVIKNAEKAGFSDLSKYIRSKIL